MRKIMQYSVQPRDQTIAKNISKNLSGKCSQKLLDHTK